jgi:hypothetical protein
LQSDTSEAAAIHRVSGTTAPPVTAFKGYSPNGQFYTQKIEYVGLGVHFHF